MPTLIPKKRNSDKIKFKERENWTKPPTKQRNYTNIAEQRLKKRYNWAILKMNESRNASKLSGYKKIQKNVFLIDNKKN